MENGKQRTTGRPSADGWDAGWEATRRRQLLAIAAATPAQRLQWLEEMIELAHRTGALPKTDSADQLLARARVDGWAHSR